MYPGAYTAEVTCLSPKATEKDVYDFFIHCGMIEHLEIIRYFQTFGLFSFQLDADWHSELGLGRTFDHFYGFIGVLLHKLHSSGECARTAYVTFRDFYALETAVLLSGATIVDQRACISGWGIYADESDPWSNSSWNYERFGFHVYDKQARNDLRNLLQSYGALFLTFADNSERTAEFLRSATTPREAVTVAQEVVTTMIAKGYVLGKDALIKAKAFDEAHGVSAAAAAKIAELSKRIGLTDKIYAGVEAVRSVDEKYHVSEFSKSAANKIYGGVEAARAVEDRYQLLEFTKSAAVVTGKTTVAAANAFVNSSYFAKGALWVSGILTRAANAAADLGNKGNKM
ncbi:Binding partner of ACD11 1 [Vitis vinifera]|uniref:Binding partner of ACD11 1 n=1 Tax=Vitis vinifera TaxID=29760 RepID=A0A438D7E5_VITVI|nr:Binding partner of ACD11 1 [Vitis vinifera]